MKNLPGSQGAVNVNRSLVLYNRIRLIIMLTGFCLAVIIALSQSGKVSDTCRSEWNLIITPGPKADNVAGSAKRDAPGLRSGSVEGLATDDSAPVYAQGPDSDEAGNSGSWDLDLIVPGLLLSLSR